MSTFEQTLHQVGVDTDAQSNGLDFALFTQPGMADAYGNHNWIVTPHEHRPLGRMVSAGWRTPPSRTLQCSNS